ncbi:MAG: HD domain-containing protein [Treponema sp.]|jgi:poly(A) polymerase|nr:HD domain-containing protein [Treponema sp.]
MTAILKPSVVPKAAPKVKPLEKIINAGFSAYLHGFSAIDSWLTGGKTLNLTGCVHVVTNAGTADLAKLFENLRYPGTGLADAALDDKDRTFCFRCSDIADVFHASVEANRFSFGKNRSTIDKNQLTIDINQSFNNNFSTFKLLEFYQDCKTRAFYDPHGIYPLLKTLRQNLNNPQNNGKNADTQPATYNPYDLIKSHINANSGYNRALMDTALILAKYTHHESETERYIKKIADLFYDGSYFHDDTAPSVEEQRLFLCSLMTSVNPSPGLELLKECGFIDEYWQELAILDEAEHNKDFHPEGNAWKHTLETFRYRKPVSRLHETYQSELRLSLGLLLHDAGKPIASSAGSRRFDGHAELGEIQARKFLERLNFAPSLISDVCFLVRYHMITAALPRLPLFRTAEIMSSDLFPALLELYRCDESSSFKGLDGYYESSAAYQTFLRNKRNPYKNIRQPRP